MSKKVGVIGSGIVGETLADGFLKHGYSVMRGSRDPQKLAAWKEKAGDAASTGTFAETSAYGDLVVLAVKGHAALEALDGCGVENLVGKVVIDATNPIAEAPPENGILSYFTGPNDSLMERLQTQAPQAKFVKAFSSTGYPNMVNPTYAEGRPSMFICGNDVEAKQEVKSILELFGWETEDMGPVQAARAIEPLAMLWCIHGFTRNEWTHSFKMLHR